MSSSRRDSYNYDTVIDQAFLDKCNDNLTCDLRLTIDIQTPDGFIYASDRNMYVGSNFYEALLTFPTIEKTIGEWLQGTLEFSVLEIRLSNVDSRYNKYLMGGESFGNWIGKTVSVKIGLRDVVSTYRSIFYGSITDIGGFSRDMQSVKIIARDKFDQVNIGFPKDVFSRLDYPFIDQELEGTTIPIIYGDCSYGIGVECFVVNSIDPSVIGAPRNNLKLIVSKNTNTWIKVGSFLERGSQLYPINAADIANINADKNYFEILQDTGNTIIEGENFVWQDGDRFANGVIGKDLGIYTNNLVAIAKDILKTYGGLVDGDFSSAWATYADKSTPPESAIKNITGFLYLKEKVNVMEQALSLLEQLRLEPFINNSLKFDLNALHFDEFDDNPSHTIREWDIVRGTFQPTTDVKNNFNRVKGNFLLSPFYNEEVLETSFFKNQNSIDQIGKEITKIIVFPNLVSKTDVENQIKEILKLSSSYLEIINCELTWRSFLLDIGDFVNLNINIQSISYDNVKAIVRKIGYNPRGLTIPITLWSFQMCPFPDYEPEYEGTIGGYNAGIVEG